MEGEATFSLNIDTLAMQRKFYKKNDENPNKILNKSEIKYNKLKLLTEP